MPANSRWDLIQGKRIDCRHVLIQRLLIYVSEILSRDRSGAKNQSRINVSYPLHFLPPKRAVMQFLNGINDKENFVFFNLVR